MRCTWKCITTAWWICMLAGHPLSCFTLCLLYCLYNAGWLLHFANVLKTLNSPTSITETSSVKFIKMFWNMKWTPLIYSLFTLYINRCKKQRKWMFELIVVFWIVAVSQGALSASGTPVTYESALWCFWEVTTRRPRLLLILFVF